MTTAGSSTGWSGTRAEPRHLSAIDPIDLRSTLDSDERAVVDNVRSFVDDRIVDRAGDWFDSGTFPVRELAPELGGIGLLGMHLDGYGCAGTSAVAYGLACLELEAGDSGLRSFVSVQGSLAMFPIRTYGSEEQKQQWLPGMAAGEIVGCFGLTEPDSGSDPGSMRTNARRDGVDWVLNGSKMWITNGNVADVAIVWARTDEGIRGFVVPSGTPGFEQRTIHRKMSLRASETGELVFNDVRLPGDAMLPGAQASRVRCRASTRRASASCTARSARVAPASPRRSTTSASARSSASPWRASSSPSRRSPS